MKYTVFVCDFCGVHMNELEKTSYDIAFNVSARGHIFKAKVWNACEPCAKPLLSDIEDDRGKASWLSRLAGK